MPSLFQSGVEQGSGAIGVQQATYVSVLDLEPADVDGVFQVGSDGHTGDEILDLTDPGQPLGDAGVYVVTATFNWFEVEASASIQTTLTVYTGAVGSSAATLADLGIAYPSGGSDAGGVSMTATCVLAEDGLAVFDASAIHNRATENLSVRAIFTIVRLY